MYFLQFLKWFLFKTKKNPIVLKMYLDLKYIFGNKMFFKNFLIQK